MNWGKMGDEVGEKQFLGFVFSVKLGFGRSSNHLELELWWLNQAELCRI
ncbi:MAG: hypothetical protein GPJ54_22660 [Candidatus Heimdallarchaeota archaeon]|nr:hypothetical protein [Candidatus Heimdallarchaeota archaeon]